MPVFRKFGRTTLGVFLAASGACCLLLAAGWFISSYHLTRSALRATGHITQMVERHGSKGEYWYPVYTFTDRDGASHTVHSDIGSAPPPYNVGDAVTVLYYPGAGDDARLDDWSTLWGAPLVVLAVGAVNLPMGFGILLWPRFGKESTPLTG